jgi:hypothetical protein
MPARASASTSSAYARERKTLHTIDNAFLNKHLSLHTTLNITMLLCLDRRVVDPFFQRTPERHNAGTHPKMFVPLVRKSLAKKKNPAPAWIRPSMLWNKWCEMSEFSSSHKSDHERVERIKVIAATANAPEGVRVMDILHRRGHEWQRQQDPILKREVKSGPAEFPDLFIRGSQARAAHRGAPTATLGACSMVRAAINRVTSSRISFSDLPAMRASMIAATS